MIRRRIVHVLPLALALSLVAVPTVARAEIQKTGSEVFPGKFMVSVNPLGFQVAFDRFSSGGYKFDADFAALVKSMDKMSLWVGGGISYGHPTYSCLVGGGGCAHDIGLMVFVRLTLEKLLKIPLVPYVQAGIGGDVLVYAGSNLGGGIPIRVGGGFHYYILKQLGLGVETNFAFGPGVFPTAPNPFGNVISCGPGNATCISFFGNWDFLLGARFHF